MTIFEKLFLFGAGVFLFHILVYAGLWWWEHKMAAADQQHKLQREILVKTCPNNAKGGEEPWEVRQRKRCESWRRRDLRGSKDKDDPMDEAEKDLFGR